VNKGNSKITELRAILQRESQKPTSDWWSSTMLPELDNLIQILFGWLGMSEWLLFNANSAIFNYIMARTS
jgi:hypothetical protein